MPRRQLTGPFRDFTAQIPWRHPFVWCLGSVVLILCALPLDWMTFLAGVALVAVLTAAAWPSVAAPERMSAADWEGYPYDDDSLARAWVDEEAVTYEVETGEVVDEIPAPQPRQIGSGR